MAGVAICALALADVALHRTPEAASPNACLSGSALLAVRSAVLEAIEGAGRRSVTEDAPAGVAADRVHVATSDAQLLASEVSDELGARCDLEDTAEHERADGRGWRLGWRGTHVKPLVLAAFAPSEQGRVHADALARFSAALTRALEPHAAVTGACAALLGRLGEAGAGGMDDAVAGAARCGRSTIIVDGRRFGREDAPLASQLARLLADSRSGGDGDDDDGGGEDELGVQNGANGADALAALSPLHVRARRVWERATVGAPVALAHGWRAAVAKLLRAARARVARGSSRALRTRQSVVLVAHFERIDVLQLEPLLHALGEGGELLAAAAPSWRTHARGAEGSVQRHIFERATVMLPWLAPSGERVSAVRAAFVLLVHARAERCASSPVDAEVDARARSAASGADADERAVLWGDRAEELRGELAEVLRCAHRTHEALPHVFGRRVDHLFDVR